MKKLNKVLKSLQRSFSIQRVAMAMIHAMITLVSFGQPVPISTDRPDQSTTPELVPLHSLQIESGYSRSTRTDAGIKEINSTYNNALIKYGLSESIEVRFATSYNALTKQNELKGKTIECPVSVGTKIKIANGNRLIPRISMVTSIALSDALGPYNWSRSAAEIILACENNLTERSSIVYNVSMLLKAKFATTAGYTLAYTYCANKHLGFYLETFGIFEPDGQEHCIDGGLTIKLSPTVQLDGCGGMNLFHSTAMYFFSAGVSVRIDKNRD